MKNNQKIIAISGLAFVVSMFVSWLFGGYDPIIETGPNLLVLVPFLLGIIIPILIVFGIVIYGIIGLFQKDHKRFIWALATCFCLLILLVIFSFPPLMVK